jgi:hypothetical protein
MTNHSDSFQADGPSVVGFQATSASIIIGARIGGTQVGVEGTCGGGNGVHGQSGSATDSGVWGENTGVGYGVSGYTRSPFSPGSDITAGVWGHNASSGAGVKGTSNEGDGVIGFSFINDHAGVSAVNRSGGFGLWATGVPAGHFEGNVEVNGTLTKSGGSFRIDHPLDPANKYLYHSFVESPDMKNIYDGVVILGDNGEAVVELPDWFESLNKDFRYQLTAIGAAAPNLHVAQEVKCNRLKIAGGNAGMKVSWSVTGIRKDAWANEHRIPVEEEKPAKARGHYLHQADCAELVEKPGLRSNIAEAA